MNNDMKAVFREGALEFLQELEQALLLLEENPDNTEEIDRVFRVMHTIKGSAAMVDLNDIARFAHTLESECDHIRQGHTKVTPEIIKMALKAHDHLIDMIEASFDGDPVSEENSTQLLNQFKEAIQAASSSREKGAYGTDRLFGIIEKILLEMDAAKDASNRQSLFNSAGASLTELYHLCIILSKESAAEFLDEFEKVFRTARVMGQNLPEEIIVLTSEVIEEVKGLLDESPVDDMDFDPDSILRALQRPMELREKLSQVAGMINNSELPLPPAEKYKIIIKAPDRGPGSTSGKERFTDMLNRLGKITKEHEQDSELIDSLLQTAQTL